MAWHDEYRDFRYWVAEELKSHCGTRFSEKGPVDSPYVPFDRLLDFWTIERIEPFLESRGDYRKHTGLLADDIRAKFLRIFTALVYISNTPEHPRIHYLDSFAKEGLDDANLPFRNKHQLEVIFAGSQIASADRTSFYESHFLFMPHSLGETINGRLTRTLHQTRLVDIEVLPMKLERVISPIENKATRVEVALFKCHTSSGLVTRNDLVVAKIFPPDEINDAFANEHKTYTSVQSEYILEYFGSFIQCGRPVILLEYADKGSLVQFFRENNLPNTRNELMNLWRDLSCLFRGLAVLHNAQPSKPSAVTHVHQDLQPSNIFVFSDMDNGTGDSQYKFLFKLGDFGSSSAKTSAEEGVHYHKKTPRVYGAPELVEFDPFLKDLDTVYLQASDIWSMGCVLIEAAVWSVGGERGRMQFLADRKEETTNEHKDIPACESTFHNGKTILETVRNRSNTLQTQVRVYDTLTQPLWDWICESLLEQEPTHRFHARQAWHFMQRLIDHAQSLPPAVFKEPLVAGKTPRSSSSAHNRVSFGGGQGEPPGLSLPTLHVTGPSPSPINNHGRHPLDRQSCEYSSDSEYIEKKPRSRIPNRTSHSTMESCGPAIDTQPTTSRTSAESKNAGVDRQPAKQHRIGSELSQQSNNLTIEALLQLKPKGPESWPSEIRSVQGLLQGRDQVFLIDDSWSMRNHWDEVRKAVEVLGLVTQEADPDGMELRFTSRPTKKLKGKKAAALVSHVNSNEPRRTGPCHMEQALNTLIDDLMPRLLSVSKAKVTLTNKARNLLRSGSIADSKKGVSVYVLTDAIWGASSDSDTTSSGGKPGVFGVDQSVRTLVARLKKENASRSWFTLQFIRFGSNAAARARLRYLDDDLKKELPGWDIVDSRSYSHSSVSAMIIGALSEVNDNSKESGDDDDQH